MFRAGLEEGILRMFFYWCGRYCFFSVVEGVVVFLINGEMVEF